MHKTGGMRLCFKFLDCLLQGRKNLLSYLIHNVKDLSIGNTLASHRMAHAFGTKIELLLLLSHFSQSDSVQPHRWQPTRLPRPRDSPGKNTGVGCHFLLQWVKVKSESEVAQSCPTLSDPMDCSLPCSSIHGIFQARVLEWGAIAFSGISVSVYLYLCVYVYISICICVVYIC